MRFDEHDVCANEIAQCHEDIRELKVLLTRAADALEKLNGCFLVEDASVDWGLIAELRKAAE